MTFAQELVNNRRAAKRARKGALLTHQVKARSFAIMTDLTAYAVEAGLISGCTTPLPKRVESVLPEDADLVIIRNTGTHPSEAVRQRLRKAGKIAFDRSAKIWKVL